MKRYLTALVLAAAVSPSFAIEPFRTINIGTRPESVCRGFDDKLFVTVMLNPNGVTSPDAGVLLVAEFFHGNILSHRDGVFEVLASGLRGADGIERGTKGELFISSWTQGKVWKLQPDGTKPEVIIDGLKSAADFFLDRKQGIIILPDMLAGTLGF